jgi:alkylation response protein AidB-like acyl-CoA dehydrogenase
MPVHIQQGRPERDDATGAGLGPLDALLSLDHPRKTAAAAWATDALGTPSLVFDRSRWEAAAAYGVQGLTAPVELGGAGRSIVDALLTFEGLGYGARDHGMVFALSSQVFAMQGALLRAGSPAQLARWIPALCEGTAIGAFAMSEPTAGSDTAAITTTATPVDGGYRINGTKTWVTLGPECDVVIVFATTDRSLGRWGLTAFLVDVDRPGVRRGEPIPKMGLESCPFGTLTFEDCVVGADDVLGRPGSGGAIFGAAVSAERAFLSAAQLGATERSIDRSVERARTRVQFGKPIGAFQAVSHRIAEMKVRHEAARLLVYKAAILADLGRDVTLAASLAKLQSSETAVHSALDAIQIFGAEGYTVAAGAEADLRHAVGGLSYSGTSDIQRNIVASLLGVDRPPRREVRDPRANPPTPPAHGRPDPLPTHIVLE